MKKRIALLLIAVLCLGVVVPGGAKAAAGKYGFIDATGNMVIAPVYDYAYSFSDGFAMVFKGTLSKYGYPDEGKYGFIDMAGNLLGDISWEDAINFHEGMAAVQKDGKYGFIDKTGKLAIIAFFDDVDSFQEGFARVFVGTMDKYGLPESGVYNHVDTSGDLLVDTFWEDASDFSQGLAAVKKDGKWRYIDTNGKTALTISYDYAYPFSEGLARVFEGTLTDSGFPDKGKYGFIDMSGHAVGQLWDDADDFSEGLAMVKLGDMYGFMDAQGDLAGGLKWENAWDMAEGLARVELGGKYGFLDASGQLAVSPQYDYAYSFSNGRAWVFSGTMSSYGWPDKGVYSLIDPAGNPVGGTWEDGYSFSDGLAMILSNGLYGYINTAGKTVIKPQYTDAGSFSQGLAAVCANQGSGATAADLRQTTWGMTREQVEGLEGAPYLDGTVSGTTAEYIAYKTTVVGLDAVLAYYFSEDGLFQARYLLNESHDDNNDYDDDYETLKSALTKKYGTPNTDSEDWDTSAHKSSYGNRKGDAVKLGYLTLATVYRTDRTTITLEMDTNDDGKVSINLYYESNFIDAPEQQEEDYFGDI